LGAVVGQEGRVCGLTLPHVPGVLPRMNVCDEANALVTGERQRAYGGPTETLTGSPTSGPGFSVSPVLNKLIGLKLGRESHTPRGYGDRSLTSVGNSADAHATSHSSASRTNPPASST
jgi:hypothetical protein